MDFLLEKDMKLFEEHFNLDKKQFIFKRWLLAISLLIIMYFLGKNYDISALIYLSPIAGIVGYKLPYIELISKKGKEDVVKEYMFPIFLRHFISLLESQGNVYQTLKACVEQSKEPIKAELQQLVDNIETESVDNRDAFMDFADFIGTSDAHMVMSQIYNFNEEGIMKDSLTKMEDTIIRLQNNKIDELIEYKVGTVGKHATPVLYYALGYMMGFVGIIIMSYFAEIQVF